MRDLRNVSDSFHVRGVAPCTEDARDLRFRIHVVRGDQCACGVARERDDVCWNGLLRPFAVSCGECVAVFVRTHVSLQALPEHLHYIVSLRVGVAESFRPANEYTVVDTILPSFQP